MALYKELEAALAMWSRPNTADTTRSGNQPHRRGGCTGALQSTGPLKGRHRRPCPMLR